MGSESFTWTAGVAVEVDVAGAVLTETDGVVVSPVLLGPGVGLPSLWPPPENGVYFFFGALYFSWCCSSFTSTSWLFSTFMIAIGARPALIIARIWAFAGSSERYNGPSSTENPSSQKWRWRSTRGARRETFAVGSSKTSLGVSSPPRVRAVPVKRDVRGVGSLLPPTLAASLLSI